MLARVADRVSYPEVKNVIRMANENLPTDLRAGLNQKLLYFREKHNDIFQRALFEINFEEDSAQFTKHIKSNNLEKQRKCLDIVLHDACDYKEPIACEYVLKTVIPHIKKTKNIDLAEYILNYIQQKSSRATEQTFRFVQQLSAKVYTGKIPNGGKILAFRTKSN